MIFETQTVKTPSPSPSLSPCAWGRGEMTNAYIANDIKAGEAPLHCSPAPRGWNQVLALVFGDEIISSLGSAMRAHPCTVPLPSSSILSRRQAIHPEVSTSGKPSYPPWHALIRVGTQVAQGHSLFSSITNSAKCSLRSMTHNPTPRPLLLPGVEGVWETQISTEEGATNRNFPAPFLPGSPAREGEGKDFSYLMNLPSKVSYPCPLCFI